MSEENTDTVVREIQKETRERLSLVELNRLGREEKRELEKRDLEGAAQAVFEEREWRKRRPETVREIEAIVDAMGTPREERLRVGERVFLPPEEPLPPTRVLTDLERKAIERHLGAKVKRASIVYRSARGHVVEVEHEKDGRADVTLLSVLGERVSDISRIRERVDAFRPKSMPEAEPEPEPEPAPPAVEPEPAPEPQPEAPSPQPVAPPPESAAEPGTPALQSAAEEPKKRRFGLPKLGRKKDDAEAPAEAAAQDSGEEPKKRRFGLPKLGKRKEAAEETPEAPVEVPEDGEEPKKKGLGRFLKRG